MSKKYLNIFLAITLLFAPNLFAYGDATAGATTSSPQHAGTTNGNGGGGNIATEINAEDQSATSVPTPETQTIDTPNPSLDQDHYMQEKCRVLDADGNGLIKPYMADSGTNLEGDANAWIWVPYGQCRKINAGDFNGVSQEILKKIQASNIRKAKTLN